MEKLHSGENNQIGFTLRVHHLGEWSNLLTVYNKNFKIKPWKFTGEHIAAKDKFIKDYVARDIFFTDLTLSNFENSKPDIDVLERIEYYRDLIGASLQDRERVTKGRVELINGYFDFVIKDRRGKVLLTIEPDGYCRTCAIGNHCKRTEQGYKLKYDRDYVYKNSLENLIDKKIISPENLNRNESEENVIITVEALFDTNFYEALWKDIIKSGNAEWL